ncbi:hypothetical protein M9Y10_031567 [Tritrichomonas musculus]|uniref:Protein kinase domain-containing protein n=1 Tax=Tritrichomonas musculus TaxID=1915356 RepID=A0ABR2H2Z9_9EUKA
MTHRVTLEYDLIKAIGKGTFSQVFEGKRKIDGKIVAIKVVKCQNETHTKIINKEIYIMKSVSGGNPSIPDLYDYFKEGSYYFIIMEYLEGYVTLLDWVNDLGQSYMYQSYTTQSISHEMTNDLINREKDIANIFAQIASCVSYLQNMCIFHRDLKLENIMINPETKNVKLIDFGLATQSDDMKWSTICGSFEYLAPEIIQNVKNSKKSNSFTFQSEIWSLGVILYCMTYYKLPFYSQNKFEMFKAITTSHLKLDDEDLFVSDDLKNLISEMLTKNPQERPYFDQIFNHPFLKDAFNQMSSLKLRKIGNSFSQNIDFKETYIKKHQSHFASSLPRSFLCSSLEFHNQLFHHKKKITGYCSDHISTFPKL